MDESRVYSPPSFPMQISADRNSRHVNTARCKHQSWPVMQSRNVRLSRWIIASWKGKGDDGSVNKDRGRGRGRGKATRVPDPHSSPPVSGIKSLHFNNSTDEWNIKHVETHSIYLQFERWNAGRGKGIGHKQEGGFMHTWRRQQHAKKRKENQAMLIASGWNYGAESQGIRRRVCLIQGDAVAAQHEQDNTSLLPFDFSVAASVSVNTEEPGSAARKRVRLVPLTCQIVPQRFRFSARHSIWFI